MVMTEDNMAGESSGTTRADSVSRLAGRFSADRFNPDRFSPDRIIPGRINPDRFVSGRLSPTAP
jgi:hypothetical protein